MAIALIFSYDIIITHNYSLRVYGRPVEHPNKSLVTALEGGRSTERPYSKAATAGQKNKVSKIAKVAKVVNDFKDPNDPIGLMQPSE